MQMWTGTVAAPRGVLHTAREIETAGWDGLVVVDSQNLSGDPYVALAMAATVTERIGLAPGVTNSVTRAAAVTACSIASVQRISKGRATLGIGRGDSALAHLGRSPGRVAQFERYLRHVQTYLSGGAVPFDELTDIPDEVAAPVADLHLADTPRDSRIDWIAGGTKVPVEVAASGKRVIAVAALHAERVVFTLGADPERINWGIALARKTREKAGLDPAGISFGAYINCGCHPDIAVAREVVRGGLTTFARFSVMQGKTSGPLSAADEATLQRLRDGYDMRSHTRGDSPQAALLTDDFIDRFAIVGPPERCIAGLRRLADLGLDKVIIGGGFRGVAEAHAATAKMLLERDVLPAITGGRVP